LGLSGLVASAKRIVVAPVSNSKIRDWGTANYARLVALLSEKSPCYVVLVGSEAQREELDRIVEENGWNRRIINIAGSSNWSETAKIVSEADLVISNNCGVAHLAAACGAPTLTIYSGSHQPQMGAARQ
jgi:ADP-heptose:LPS heptosyltransferase